MGLVALLTEFTQFVVPRLRFSCNTQFVPVAGVQETVAKPGDAGTMFSVGALLVCTTTGNTQKPPKKCPNPKCGKPLLRAVGAGTQRLEEEVKRLFPKARIKRVDRDSASGVGFHEELGQAMHAGEIDILLGTQDRKSVV